LVHKGNLRMPPRGRPAPPRRPALRPGHGAGRWAARGFAGLLAAAIALACGTNSALAASDPGSAGLRVGLAGTAAAPQLTLTNGSSAPCQVPDAGLGTFAITQVTQGGKSVEPVSYSAWFDDWVPDYLATRLRTLAPGQSLTVPMPVVTTTATGTALESASWVGPETSTDALYPIKAGQPVQVKMNYAATVTTDGAVPLCTGSDTSATATLAAAGGSGSSAGKIAGIPRMTFIYAGAGVLILLLLALFVYLRVRKHRSSAVTNAVVVLALVACSMVLSTASAPQASATVFLGPGNGNLSKDFNFCMSSFAAPGGDPSSIMSTVMGSGVSVQVVDGAGDENHEIQLLPKQLQIFWDPTDTHPYVGGGNADKCTTLYHELDHAYQDLTGGQTRSDCWTTGPDGNLHDSGLPTNEVQATREQNMLRVNLGLPPRKTYGSTPLPSGQCHPPPPNNQPQPKACAGNGCGNSNGDPHLITFDGFRYDFQAVGEFVAADDPTDGFQVQVRQQQYSGTQVIAVNTAVAMDVDGDRVQVGLSSQGLALLVNGKAQSATSATLAHGGKVATGYGTTGENMTVTWPDSSTAVISQISVWGLHLSVTPAASHAGHLRGLLGDLSTGTGAAPGIEAADGTTITEPSFSTLYPAFANGWRITDATSLFTYAPGTSTATYTDLSFPHAPATIKSVPDLAAATAQCTNAGITDPVTLQDCEIDVGLTGESAFADADAQSQPGQAIAPPAQNGGSFGIDGGPATATVTAPDGSTSLQFTGAAGQVVFVDVPKSTLTNQCNVLELKDPRDNVLNQGCILNGSGSILATTLPQDGTYSVLVGPATKPGTATVQLYQDFDQTAAITPDGPPVTATIGQPGAKSTLTFDAGPGTSVYVEVTSTNLPSQCGVPELLSPTGSDLAQGCSINGSGSISETTLQASGRYEIVVDPSVPDTGSAVIKLITDHDQTAPIAIGGPPVTSVIAVPGEKSMLTFQGTAGQSVSVQASGSTLPSACGDFDLYGPGDDELATSCILNGTGSIPATKLPSTGQYTIRLVPTGGITGSTVIRLTAG
jgi:von Willebrand factor type D domain